MSMESELPSYKLWGVDNVVYGPVELPGLVMWVKEERVLSGNWIYLEHKNEWMKARDIEELKMFFKAGIPSQGGSMKPQERQKASINPNVLRRIKVFSGLSERQLEGFLGYIDITFVSQFDVIVKQGNPGDAMYMVLEGELRVRLMIDNQESTLATLGPGELFGDVSLFDHGPRSADVVANEDSQLVKMKASEFQRLVKEAPELAAPFLAGIGKTLTARIRSDNKRFADAIHMHRASN